MTWTNSEIQQARKTLLAPLLEERGYKLEDLPGGNFRLSDFGDLTIKESYWRWGSRKLQGNAIDLLIVIEGRTFTEAMAILCPKD